MSAVGCAESVPGGTACAGTGSGMPCDEAGDSPRALERIPGMKKDQSQGTDPFGLSCY